MSAPNRNGKGPGGRRLLQQYRRAQDAVLDLFDSSSENTSNSNNNPPSANNNNISNSHEDAAEEGEREEYVPDPEDDEAPQFDEEGDYEEGEYEEAEDTDNDEHDDDIETFTGDGGHETQEQHNTASARPARTGAGQDGLRAALLNHLRTRQLQASAQQRRPRQLTDDEDEEGAENHNDDDDENDDGDANDEGNQVGGDLRSLLQFLQRSSMGFGLGAGPRGGLYSPSNDPSRRSGLISGQAFVDSINQKRDNLLRHHSRELLAPIAESGCFMMQPNPSHVPTAAQVRLGVSSAPASTNSTSTAQPPISTSAFQSPMTTFWNEFEDSIDDSILAMAKHDLRAELQHMEQVQRNRQRQNDGEDAAVEEEEEDKQPQQMSNQPESVTAPRNLTQKSKNGSNQNTQEDAASPTPSARQENKNDDEDSDDDDDDEKDYSPWVGPSPSSATNTTRNAHNTQQTRRRATTTSTAAAVATITRTAPSSSSSSSSTISNCIRFLRTPPKTLPSTCRGTMHGSHMMQPISGFALSSSDSACYNDGESILFAMGSRGGVLAVGAFDPSQWKSMMMAPGASRSRRHVDPTSSAVTQDGEDHDHDNQNDDEYYDDPEFAQMGRRNNSGRTAAANNRSTNNSSNRYSNTLSFPIQHVEMIRRSGPPMFDTAWSPTLPIYAATGGFSEMTLGFAGDIVKKVSGRGAEDVLANAENNDQEADGGDDEENDPILSKNILPRLNTPTNPNSKRARKIVVDITSENDRTARIFGVAFFGQNCVACACNAGHFATVQIRPDGQFHVASQTTHTDDVNTVARFGRDPETPLLISGADDRRVALSDTRISGGSVAFGYGHALGIMSVAARGDDYFFASVGKDQVVKLWDARNLNSAVTSSVITSSEFARREREEENTASLSWNHYNSPASAPVPCHTRSDKSVLSMPNSQRFVYTLCRAKFSPYQSTGGRYLLVGGCGGSQIFDIVAGSVVSNLIWTDAGSADEVMRDVAWVDEGCVMSCTQSAAYVYGTS